MLIITIEDIGLNSVFALSNKPSISTISWPGSSVLAGTPDPIEAWDNKTYRRNLLWQIDLLGQGHFTWFQRTFKIHIDELFTEIGCLPEKSDQAIFDLQKHISTILDLFMQGAR